VHAPGYPQKKSQLDLAKSSLPNPKARFLKIPDPHLLPRLPPGQSPTSCCCPLLPHTIVCSYELAAERAKAHLRGCSFEDAASISHIPRLEGQGGVNSSDSCKPGSSSGGEGVQVG
jgi:hypothetical protein